MIYLKSVIVGLLALVVIPILFVAILVVGMIIYGSIHPSQGSVGWDPISMWRQNPIFWVIPVLIFSAGFIWEYRRVSGHH